MAKVRKPRPNKVIGTGVIVDTAKTLQTMRKELRTLFNDPDLMEAEVKFTRDGDLIYKAALDCDVGEHSADLTAIKMKIGTGPDSEPVRSILEHRTFEHDPNIGADEMLNYYDSLKLND